MLKAFRGSLLKIDLTQESVSTEELNEKFARLFLGGAGYACRYLYDKLEKDTDPLSPENIIMIMNGPLNGTFAPNTGRWVICSKSPYTGIWGESNCGSWFGAEIKKAGYDGIVISGKAKNPVYVAIKDDEIAIKEASSLWGKGTYYTTKKLKSLFNNERAIVACIGPAGENLVKYANIVSEERSAGRTGMGAIFGSKNLKAIIVKGTNTNVEVDNPEKLKIAIKNARDTVKASFGTQVLTALGTSGVLDMYNSTGELPIKYFTESEWEKAYDISGATMAESILTRNRFCHSCVIGCGRRVEIKEGEYTTDEIEGPEYETIVSFGSLILNNDLKAIVHLSKICFDYGVDTISSGSTIACLIHHYQLGNIVSDEIEDLKPNWGDIALVERLLKKIAYREGIGDLLAEGSNALAKKFGISQEEIATVVGLEITYHDLRSNYGMAIAYGMGGIYRGPSHNACDPYFTSVGVPLEELGMEIPDNYNDGKEMVKYCSIDMDYRALYSSMIMCVFCNPLPSQNAAIIETATGIKCDINQIKLFGERILTMKRLFNLRMGLSLSEERLPKLLLRPLKSGGSEGKSPDFSKMRRLLYEYREWNLNTGKPSEDKLRRLNLNEIQ